MMSTMQRVREAMEASHVAIEQTDFAQSLLDGRITRPAYCKYLSQMWHIHYQVEQTLPACSPAGKYFHPEMIRTAAISRDLLALGQPDDFHAPLPATRRILQQLQTWAHEAPYALLGCCYILEGSRMGSLMIGRALINHLKLHTTSQEACPAGVEYHLEDAAQTPRRVKQLKSAIDADHLSPECEEELTEGACTFMSLLNELYRQLPVNLSHAPATNLVCPMHQHGHVSQLKTA